MPEPCPLSSPCLHLQGGVRTLWKGTQPTVIRLGLGAGLHFFFLETIKPVFEQRHADGSMGMSAMGAMVTGAPVPVPHA